MTYFKLVYFLFEARNIAQSEKRDTDIYNCEIKQLKTTDSQEKSNSTERNKLN